MSWLTIMDSRPGHRAGPADFVIRKADLRTNRAVDRLGSGHAVQLFPTVITQMDRTAICPASDRGVPSSSGLFCYFNDSWQTYVADD